MPVDTVVPHEAAMRLGAWLGEEVRPPEQQSKEQGDAAFQQLIKEAGIEEFTDSLKDQDETESRNQARARRLVSYMAGLVIGSNLGLEKVRPEIARVVREIKERQAAENPFELKSGSHEVQDAWHKVVVDQYGREDLSAREQYGAAFQQEQKEIQQSALSDDTPRSRPIADDNAQPQPQQPTPSFPVPPQVPAIPEPYQVPAIGPTPPIQQIAAPIPRPPLPVPYPSEPTLPAGLTQPMLQPGQPLREDPQRLLPAHFKSGVDLILNPWVWFVIGLLILVFFAVSVFG